MTSAISYALSGHLVLSTLHANNSYHALGRILSFYAPEARAPLLADLAAGLRAIVSQRLLQAAAGGRVPAVEVLLNTKLVAELIEQGDFTAVSSEAMEKSLAAGSQTFEQDLARLMRAGIDLARRGAGARRLADQPALAARRTTRRPPPPRAAARTRPRPIRRPLFTEFTLDVRHG